MENKEIPEILYKDKERSGNYYFTVEIPVKYKVKAEYERYEDEFGNSYYEDNYSYDTLSEAKRQNPKLQEALDYILSCGFKFCEEGID